MGRWKGLKRLHCSGVLEAVPGMGPREFHVPLSRGASGSVRQGVEAGGACYLTRNSFRETKRVYSPSLSIY